MKRLDDIFITNVNSEGSFSADLPDGEYSLKVFIAMPLTMCMM